MFYVEPVNTTRVAIPLHRFNASFITTNSLLSKKLNILKLDPSSSNSSIIQKNNGVLIIDGPGRLHFIGYARTNLLELDKEDNIAVNVSLATAGTDYVTKITETLPTVSDKRTNVLRQWSINKFRLGDGEVIEPSIE